VWNQYDSNCSIHRRIRSRISLNLQSVLCCEHAPFTRAIISDAPRCPPLQVVWLMIVCAHAFFYFWSPHSRSQLARNNIFFIRLVQSLTSISAVDGNRSYISFCCFIQYLYHSSLYQPCHFQCVWFVWFVWVMTRPWYTTAGPLPSSPLAWCQRLCIWIRGDHYRNEACMFSRSVRFIATSVWYIHLVYGAGLKRVHSGIYLTR